jgi:amino acid transporter
MKHIIVVLVLMFGLQMIAPVVVNAQCAMCKATLESNAKNDKSKIGAGLNTGIIYLMVIPYLIFGVLGYLWFKNSKKQKIARIISSDDSPLV